MQEQPRQTSISRACSRGSGAQAGKTQPWRRRGGGGVQRLAGLQLAGSAASPALGSWPEWAVEECVCVCVCVCVHARVWLRGCICAVNCQGIRARWLERQHVPVCGGRWQDKYPWACVSWVSWPCPPPGVLCSPRVGCRPTPGVQAWNREVQHHICFNREPLAFWVSTFWHPLLFYSGSWVPGLARATLNLPTSRTPASPSPLCEAQ